VGGVDRSDDATLVGRLREGDEGAFVALVERYHSPLLRLAQAYVPSRAVAEEVVQDTWLGVMRGIERFEGRASFKTWLFRILVNRARTTGQRERRIAAEPAVDPSRFDGAGAWTQPPAPWTDAVEERLTAVATVARIRQALEELPPGPRQVVMLRDVDGLSSNEVCEVLSISEGNQRVLLHRGRSRIRALLEAEFGGAS
jgi:RNA polymerase sigma-70 factor, ECF subfamily